MSRSRRLVILGGKLAVAVLLIGWLLYAGTLDLGALRLFVDRPSLLIANLAVLAFGVMLGALRWRLLLRLADVQLSLGRALQLHATGLFFNVVIPGNIGGDVVKSVYVARDAAPSKRPTVFLIAFVDRLMGVASLVVVAFVMTMLRGRMVWEVPRLRELAIIVVVLTALTIIGPIIVLVLIRHDRFSVGSPGTTRFARILDQLVAATRLVSAGPRTLVVALMLAIALHVVGMTFFAALTIALSPQDVSVSSIASVYPLGMMTLMLPISPAGIGVGHVAFERLLEIVGIAGGATVFNVYLIGQTTPCLLGVLPYLTLRRQSAIPTVEEATAQQAGTSP